MRRLTRILLWTAGAILTLVLLAGVIVETPYFKNWLLTVIVKQANDHLNGTLAIGQFKGNLFTGAELDDVSGLLDNEKVMSIDTVKVHYSIPRLLFTEGTTIESLTLVHPIVAAHREGDGWQLSRLIRKDVKEADRRGPVKPIAIRHIDVINGHVTVDKAAGKRTVDIPDTYDAVNAAMSFAYAPVHFAIGIDSMSFVASNPAVELRQVNGAIAVESDKVNLSTLTVRTAETTAWADGAIENYLRTPTLKLQVSLTPLSLPELHRLVPAVKDMDLAPDINAKLNGTTEGLKTEVSVRSTAGNFDANGKMALTGPDRIFQGELAVHHLDLAPFLRNPEQKSDIVVYAKVDLRGPAGFDTLRGTVAGDAPLVETHGWIVEGIRANAKIDGRTIRFDTSERAYRSNTTAAGSVTFASDERPETRFDVRGVVKDVGVAYLPTQMRIPPAETKLTANYHVNIIIPRKPGWHVDGDATLAQSVVAGVTISDGGRTTFLFEPNVVQYSADMNVSDVDLKRIGDQFGVTALQNPRYRTSLNGHVVANVKGTAVETMDLTASGMLNDSQAFGGRLPQMTFDSTLNHDALHVKANGQFEKINAAIAADKPSLESSLTGDVEADLTLNHLSKGTDLDSFELALTTDLGPSAIGDATIDKAYISGDYKNSFADIYQIEVTGNDVIATGHGTLAFNERDKSGFWIHAEAAHLESVNTLVKNGAHALTGIGTLDAVVGGNRKEFTINGTATGNGIRYDEYGALAASTKFAAKLPDLDPQQATVTADSQATFVDVHGFEVNELTAKTEYKDKAIAYDVTAKQPLRQFVSQGSLTVHPDHNEVHLTAFRLTSQGVSWQMIDGHRPAIQWGHDLFIVKDFALTDSAAKQQQLLANGTFGKPGEALTVELKNFDLSALDAILLRPPQLTGAANAKAVVTGTKEAPNVAADFSINNGKFRNVPWQSFGGTAKYTPAVIVVDTKLQQNAAQWMTAKGELPVSLFRGKTSESAKVDFHIDSSTVDLGLIQGFTDAVTGVTGTVQAKLDLTGSSAEPRANGAVTFANGGFKVEDTGVVYKAFNGKIDFQQDRVHITDLHVLDADNDSLSLTGDLGVAGLQVSAVNLGFYADNFKVIGNEMGNMHVSSNLELTGTLAHPKLQGDLGVSTGTVNLDPILARIDSAYSTTSIDTTKTVGSNEDTRPGLLGTTELDLHLTIPDDLVVKADDLKTGAAPIGLGKVNITLGGDVNVSAAPGKPLTFVGEVNTVRGFYDYQGRRFTILRDGKIRFEGDPVTQLDPALDVAGERMIQAVTVRVNVRGHLRMPEIELTSTPPQEQADILALIVFNQPMNALAEGQQLSLAQRAGSIAAGAVTNQLTGSIANSLNLDQFEINLTPDSGSVAELTVGQQLGQNLYVKVQQGIGDNSQTNFVLEYEFNKWMRLQTNVLEGSAPQQQLFQRVKSTGADLVFTFQFK